MAMQQHEPFQTEQHALQGRREQVRPLCCKCRYSTDNSTHRIPLLGEVISIMDEEVPPIDMDEGAHAQVLGPVALLPLQLLALAGDVEVLQAAHHRQTSAQGES